MIALPVGGFYRYRRSGEAHYWDGNLIHQLQNAVETDSYGAYKRYSDRVVSAAADQPARPARFRAQESVDQRR